MNETLPINAGIGGPIAIVSGGGTLPFATADAAMQRGRRAVLLALRGSADPVRVADYPHHWIAVGQIGRMCRLARQEGCRDMVFIGGLVRPTLSQLRFDFETVRLLPRLARIFRGGDGHFFHGIVNIFEERGFKVVGAHEVAPSILMPEGPLGRNRPSATDLADIQRGLEFLHATGPFDVGQAVVIAQSRILGVEAAEGTDHMLARFADVRRSGRIRIPAGTGVLVKAPKQGQDRRIDLPSIGPKTIDSAINAGLNGIAVVAGSAIVAEPNRIAEMADRANLFVVGVRDETAPQ
jgi:UDP-2,3-diacylglucosamine hydrolase